MTLMYQRFAICAPELPLRLIIRGQMWNFPHLKHYAYYCLVYSNLEFNKIIIFAGFSNRKQMNVYFIL